MLAQSLAPHFAAVAARSRAPGGSSPIQLDAPLGLSDAELARRVGNGERWAVEAFYRRHIVQVLGLAQRLLGNSADAEDVAQDTFATAFEIWHQLRDFERSRAWLLQIAVRKVHRKFRKRRVLRLLGLDQTVADLPLDALAREDLSAELRSELMLLDAALRTVAPQAKIAWLLRYVEGLGMEQVAERCECSLATAKRRVAAAQRVVLERAHLELEVEP